MRLLLSLLALLMLSACADPGPPPGGSVAEMQRIDEAIGAGAVAAPGQSVTAVVTARPNAPGQTRLEVVSTPTIQPPAEVVAVCGAP